MAQQNEQQNAFNNQRSQDQQNQDKMKSADIGSSISKKPLSEEKTTQSSDKVRSQSSSR